MTDEPTARVAADLAADLAVAHRRVRALDVADNEKALASRRLLAISDASKHDVRRAAKRLQAFMSDLDEGRITRSKRANDD
ncbi:MAG: hypothetical protein JJD92_08605 [Frankiaceae bacterium]|nr:hypothetical protein [Frankiaceae bacterium]